MHNTVYKHRIKLKRRLNLKNDKPAAARLPVGGPLWGPPRACQGGGTISIKVTPGARGVIRYFNRIIMVSALAALPLAHCALVHARHAHMCMHTCACTHVHVHVHVHVCMCMCMCACACACACHAMSCFTIMVFKFIFHHVHVHDHVSNCPYMPPNA